MSTSKSDIVTNPKVGKSYKLSWAKTNYKFKLLSWDNSGTCIMKGSINTKNNFKAHLNDLRK